MKKTQVKKLLALITAALLCLAIPGVSAIAAQPESDATPYNVAIAATDNNLEMNTTGVLSCYGATEVKDGYYAGIVVELQQFDGSNWGTIKTWTVKAADWAVVEEDYSVAKGYDYRLYITHTSYNSNWVELESFVKKSNIIGYH